MLYEQTETKECKECKDKPPKVKENLTALVMQASFNTFCIGFIL